MYERIKRYFFPVVSADVQRNIDADSIRNIHQLTFAVTLFELITLAFYAPSEYPFSKSAWISLCSVSFCVLFCLIGFVVSGRMLKKNSLSHMSVAMLKSIYSFVFSIWAVFVSYRQYLRGEQLVTFYAVMMIVVCFIPLKPVISMVLVSTVHASLYITIYNIDGAQGINPFNYAVFVLVSIAGMIVRCWSQIRMSEESVKLQKSNDMLEHVSRHDSLTQLRNRKALEEDVSMIVGNNVTAYMIDINYFKEINDTYGHVFGDSVLIETAKCIKKLFPNGHCYRYGGDEFLVLCSGEGAYENDTYGFSVTSTPHCAVMLSIGHANGCPVDHDQIFKIIDEADSSLYNVKRRTHSPEFGGHDRRHT